MEHLPQSPLLPLLDLLLHLPPTPLHSTPTSSPSTKLRILATNTTVTPNTHLQSFPHYIRDCLSYLALYKVARLVREGRHTHLVR